MTLMIPVRLIERVIHALESKRLKVVMGATEVSALAVLKKEAHRNSGYPGRTHIRCLADDSRTIQVYMCHVINAMLDEEALRNNTKTLNEDKTDE